MPDTTNLFMISAVAHPSRYAPLKVIPWPLCKDECLSLAAWLVAVTGEEAKFQELLKAVLDT